jgi:hypothetical protein
MKRRAAGDQNAELRAARDQFTNLVGRWEEVLEVVQKEQEPPAAYRRAQLQLRP